MQSVGIGMGEVGELGIGSRYENLLVLEFRVCIKVVIWVS